MIGVVMQLTAICIGSWFFGAIGSGAAILVSQALLAALLAKGVLVLVRSEQQQVRTQFEVNV